MQLDNTRFGTIQFQEGDVVTLPDGMVGFPQWTRFVLVQTREGSPFRWLQSVEDPSLAFLLADPTAYCPDYAPELPDAVAAALGLTEQSPCLLLVTAAIPRGRPEDMTLNLAAPVLINMESRIGAQVILESEAYTMKHRVFAEAPQAVDARAA
ncbi:MAG: flagellar assembly protein FliW [Fimbriimonadales bacterium]|nr:flagellar assembly protein FliW [Fimbriimonadales bacterium]